MLGLSLRKIVTALLVSVFVLDGTGRVAALRDADSVFFENLRKSRHEMAAFDRSIKRSADTNPRRKWADYFWTYYEQHSDAIEGAQAAARALSLLTELRAYREVMKKSRALDPQNDAWAWGGLQAFYEAAIAVNEFQEFFEKAEGLIGITLTPEVRDAARLTLARAYITQQFPSKAKPLLEVIVAQSSDPRMLRAAKRELCRLALKTTQAPDCPTIPQQAVSSLGIKRGSVVADIGADADSFTFRLAEAVQPSGKVYAVVTDSANVASLQAEIRRRNLMNAHLIAGAEADPPLPNASFDVVVFAHSYHTVKNRLALLDQMHRALKPHGSLAIIGDSPPLGENHFLNEEVVREEVTDAGFKLAGKQTLRSSELMLVFSKSK